VLLITDEKVEANDNREYPDWLDRARRPAVSITGNTGEQK
jgi:hypothetical protein